MLAPCLIVDAFIDLLVSVCYHSIVSSNLNTLEVLGLNPSEGIFIFKISFCFVFLLVCFFLSFMNR